MCPYTFPLAEFLKMRCLIILKINILLNIFRVIYKFWLLFSSLVDVVGKNHMASSVKISFGEGNVNEDKLNKKLKNREISCLDYSALTSHNPVTVTGEFQFGIPVTWDSAVGLTPSFRFSSQYPSCLGVISCIDAVLTRPSIIIFSLQG